MKVKKRVVSLTGPNLTVSSSSNWRRTTHSKSLTNC